MYSLDVEIRPSLSGRELDDVKKMSAKKLKGVAKSAVRKYCTHEAYKLALNSPSQPPLANFKKIVVQDDSSMVTSQIAKKSLSCFDSKRYMIDNIYSRPFGHYKNILS